MKLSRPSRLLTIGITLVSLLFMQVAVAAYVCPQMPLELDSAMPGCTGMDATQPALCHAHAQGDMAKQSLDKPPLPDVSPFALSGSAFFVHSFVSLATERSNVPQAIAPLRITAPPIAIRHCCLRT